MLALDPYEREESTAINLGNGNDCPVLEVIEAARQVTSHPIAVEIEPPRPGDPSHLVADASKARDVLNGTAPPDLADNRNCRNGMRHPLGYADTK